MIKNIIFDMGNVLFDYNPQVPLDSFCQNKDAKKLIRKELFDGPEWVLRDQGLITLEDEFNRIKNRIPEKYHKALSECIYNWTICMNPIKKSLAFFSNIKEQGYNVYVLSNAADEFYSYFNKFASPSEFNGIIISSEIQLIKPDKRIYEYALSTWNIKPEESLFIDDNINNVNAAKELGINSIQFKNNYTEIESYLNRLYNKPAKECQ